METANCTRDRRSAPFPCLHASKHFGPVALGPSLDSLSLYIYIYTHIDLDIDLDSDLDTDTDLHLDNDI